MLALVLSGGGAKGDFEVGAIRFLTDQELVPDLVCSTSVGSVNALKVMEGPGGTPGLETAWLSLLGNGDMYSRELWTIDPEIESVILGPIMALVAGPLPTSPTLNSIPSLPKLAFSIAQALDQLPTATGSSLDDADILRLAGFFPVAGQVMGFLVGICWICLGMGNLRLF